MTLRSYCFLTVLISMLLVVECIAGLPVARASTTLNIQPSSSDTYVDGGSPNVNFGMLASVDIVALGNQSQRGLFAFGLASIPQGQVIISATLSLYLTKNPSKTRTWGEHRVLANWTELGATWNNQPSFVSTPTSTNATVRGKEMWLSWNVTADVANGYADPSRWYGFLIKDEQESSGSPNSAASIASRESSNSTLRPTLAVTYALQIPEIPIWLGLFLLAGGVFLFWRNRFQKTGDKISHTGVRLWKKKLSR